MSIHELSSGSEGIKERSGYAYSHIFPIERGARELFRGSQSSNVGKTIIKHPQFYENWVVYIEFPNGWFMIVLPT